MRFSIASLLLLSFLNAWVASHAQTVQLTKNVTTTVVRNVHLSGLNALYGDDGNNDDQRFVFFTSDLPDAGRILVQADLATSLTTAQYAFVHALPIHNALSVSCPEFNLLTIVNAKTGQVKKTGTGRRCAIDSLR